MNDLSNNTTQSAKRTELLNRLITYEPESYKALIDEFFKTWVQSDEIQGRDKQLISDTVNLVSELEYFFEGLIHNEIKEEVYDVTN